MAPTILERAIDRLQNEPVNADAKKPDQGLNVGEFILAQLGAWGVERIYGVIGDANLFLLDDIAKQNKIQYVPFLDENAAALAASAEAKLTGRVGVVLGTCGPGLANMLNGLGDAWADGAGVLAITGQVDAAKVGTHTKQYMQQQLAVMPFAAFSETLASPDALPELLQRCLTMSAARGAVTHLSVPKYMYRDKVKGAVLPYAAHLHQPLLAPLEDVEATFRLIAEAKRPMLLLGRGVEAVKREALAFAEALGAAVATTLPAKHVFPNGHQLFVGGFGLAGSEAASVAMAESDLVVICGATWWPDQYSPPSARVVQIDAVRENIGIGHAVERGLVGDLRDIMPRFAGMAETLARDESAKAAWQRRITDLRIAWASRVEAE
ncbi:MAG TPA: thiamine pyrophosphate-binding protein, partial [Paenibacillus sp.]|nr:thiamine pyrophosphate-binding protein [Paenibacillus sp.]